MYILQAKRIQIRVGLLGLVLYSFCRIVAADIGQALRLKLQHFTHVLFSFFRVAPTKIDFASLCICLCQKWILIHHLII